MKKKLEREREREKERMDMGSAAEDRRSKWGRKRQRDAIVTNGEGDVRERESGGIPLEMEILLCFQFIENLTGVRLVNFTDS